MSLGFSTALVIRRERSWKAMVVAPQRRILLGRERLVELRTSRGPSSVDADILEAVEAEGDVRLLVFRSGRPGDAASWRFSPNLARAELDELAYLMLLGQLALCRDLIKCGVVAFVHTELEAYEREALGNAVDRILGELCEEDADAAITRRILSRLYFFLTCSGERALNHLLPEAMALLDLRQWGEGPAAASQSSMRLSSPGVARDSAFRAWSVGGVHLSIWSKEASVSDVTALHEELAELVAERSELHLVLVVEEGVGLSTKDARQRAQGMLEQLTKHVASVTVVLDGDRLWMLALRGMFWGMAVLVRPKFPWSVAASLEEAESKLTEMRAEGGSNLSSLASHARRSNRAA